MAMRYRSSRGVTGTSTLAPKQRRNLLIAAFIIIALSIALIVFMFNFMDNQAGRNDSNATDTAAADNSQNNNDDSWSIFSKGELLLFGGAMAFFIIALPFVIWGQKKQAQMKEKENEIMKNKLELQKEMNDIENKCRHCGAEKKPGEKCAFCGSE